MVRALGHVDKENNNMILHIQYTHYTINPCRNAKLSKIILQRSEVMAYSISIR